MRFFNKHLFIGIGAGAVLTIALIFLAGYVLYLTMAPSPEKMEAMLRPPEFPSNQQVSVYDQIEGWSVRSLEGTEVELSQFKGRVVFVNFWATWCKPCVTEMPSIQSLYNHLKHEGVVFLLISEEKEETVQDFVDEKRYSFPVYLCAADRPPAFKSRGIPATFILDRDGEIVFKHVGSAKWDDKSCRSFLRGLL